MKSSNSSNFFTIIKVLSILVVIGLLAAWAIFTYKSYDNFLNPKNATIIIQNTEIINQGDSQLLSNTKWIIILILVVICLALYFGKGKGVSYDVEKKIEETFIYHIKKGYYFEDGNGKIITWERLLPEQKNGKLRLNALAWTLPGTQVYFMNEDVRFVRILIRFWCRPVPRELITTDWEPPQHEVYCCTINPTLKNVLERVHFMHPMTAEECDVYVHKQVYGLRVSPEPRKAGSLIEAQFSEKIKEQAFDIQQKAIAEGAVKS